MSEKTTTTLKDTCAKIAAAPSTISAADLKSAAKGLTKGK